MRGRKQILTGLMIALASFGIILGGLSLSLAEGEMAFFVPTSPPATPASPLPTPYIGPTATPLPPTETATLPPPPTNCPAPQGWIPITIQVGQTLESLAVIYNVSMEELMRGNCLLTTTLLPGAVLYVPPMPTATLIPCGHPPGWITYTVQRGDTLYSLAQYYGVSVSQLQQANCLGDSTLITAGQVIYVPNLPSRTPQLTPTFTETPTPTRVNTETPSVTPSVTPSTTPTMTPSATPSVTPTNTPTNTTGP